MDNDNNNDNRGLFPYGGGKSEMNKLFVKLGKLYDKVRTVR